MTKLVRLLLLIICMVVALAAFFLEQIAPKWVVQPFRPGVERAYWRMPRGADPIRYNLRVTPIEVISADSLRLRGWWCEALHPTVAEPSGLTIIVLHGISSRKEHFLTTAQRLTERGHRVVLMDLRAHGESEGKFCTFGLSEKYDIRALVDTLLLRDPHQKIGIFGHSLGGAVALQALAIEPRLRFGIIESTFHDLTAVAGEYARYLLGFNNDFLLQRVLRKAGDYAGFSPTAIQPFRAAAQIRQPIFMAHGERDERIPHPFGKINFEHLASTQKQWHTVAGGTHLTLWRAGGEPYIQLIFNFLQAQR